MDFRATFSNDENILIPGDFVKVKVYSNQKNNVLVVPQDIVLQDTRGRFVYVVDEEGLVQARYFKDNGQYENYWIIKDGLKKGDKYITTNLTKLMPRMKVNIESPQVDKQPEETKEIDKKVEDNQAEGDEK